MHTLHVELIGVALIFTMMLPPAHAQNSPQSSEARKFAEFSADINPLEMKARLDGFANALRKEPTAEGWIYYYSGVNLPGAATRLTFVAQAYLRQASGLPSVKAGSWQGGQRTESTLELWLVPAGANRPKPTPMFTMTDYRAKFKWDEMNYFLQNEKKLLTGKEAASLNSNFYYDQTTWLDGFGMHVSRPQTPRGLIVVFPKAGDEPDLPQKIADYQRRYLYRTRGLEASRLELKVGEYSETRKVELWLVPGVGPMLMAEFSPVTPEQTAGRLDELVYALQSLTGVQLGSKIYLVAYSGSCLIKGAKQSVLGETLLAEMKEYLSQRKKIDAVQIVTIDGGEQKECSVELWLVPPAALEPKPKLSEP